MADGSKIEWTDASWNPIRARRSGVGADGEPWERIGWHCEHATTGCEGCYAEGFNMRLGTGLPFKPGYRKDIELFLDAKTLELPLRWKKPRMIFVCSMTDLFADFVEDVWIDKMFAVMALCPQHTFQVLTKRAERMRDYCRDEAAPFRIAKAIDALRMQPTGSEEIRAIANYPGYFISSYGHVYSDKRGKRRRLRPDAGEQGHLRVMLYPNGDKTNDRLLVHRLVLEAFVGPPPTPETQGRHRDGNPGNNALTNLRWGDQEANWNDSKRHGTHRRYAKLTADQVAHIRSMLLAGTPIAPIAEEFDVSDTQIRNIRDGKQWVIEAPIEWPLKHCWLGVSAERQEEADERIPLLLQTPALVRFVSLEPLLGPIKLWGDSGEGVLRGCGVIRDGAMTASTPHDPPEGVDTSYPGLDWVIVGGESGREARPMMPNWARYLRDQCNAADVPFFFKQWGEYAETDFSETLERVGKKAAGRLLDGREWNEVPS